MIPSQAQENIQLAMNNMVHMQSVVSQPVNRKRNRVRRDVRGVGEQMRKRGCGERMPGEFVFL